LVDPTHEVRSSKGISAGVSRSVGVGDKEGNTG